MDNKDVVLYLENLWNDNIIIENQIISNNILSYRLSEIKEFLNSVNNLFNEIKIVNNSGYCSGEKMTGLKKTELTDDDIFYTFIALKQLQNFNTINDNILSKINKVSIYPKYKSNEINNPSNYRYIQNHSKSLKLLDKFWCYSLIEHIKKLDTNIFICNIIKGMTHDIIYYADKNTQSMEDIILLDLEKAFDNVSYDVLEKLLLNNISRKNNMEFAEKTVAQYMFIIKNRQLYYDKNIIVYKKGLPTGLTSSSIVYTMLLDEIIYEWITNNPNIIINNDLVLNIFVDDFYIKILNKSKLNTIISTLISSLEKYKLKVNLSKCRVDKNLIPYSDILQNFSILKEDDMYLGIPFTRDYTKYTELIHIKYNERYNLNTSYSEIYSDGNFKKIKYFTYKMKPVIMV